MSFFQLLSVLMLVSTVLLARALDGRWTAPASFFGLVWCAAAVPAAVLLPEVTAVQAICVVWIFVVAVLVGSQAARPMMALSRLGDMRAAPGTMVAVREPAPLVAGVLLMTLAGLAACVGYVWEADYRLVDLRETSTWLAMAVHNAAARYHQDYLEPFVLRLLLSAIYAGAILGGALIAVAASMRMKLIGVSPVLAGALITVITTAKAPFLMSIVWALAAWLSTRELMRDAGTQRGSFARRALLALGVLAGAAITLGSLVLRYGADDSDSALIAGRVFGYVFGQMAAFSAWLETSTWWRGDLMWGQFTFSGLYDTLGFAQRIQGIYDPIALNEWAAESNVFTALRGLIMDFGLFGAVLLSLVAGFAASWSDARLRLGIGGLGSWMTLTIFFGFVAWSPFASIFGYNVILLSVVVSMCVLAMAWRQIASRVVPLHTSNSRRVGTEIP